MNTKEEILDRTERGLAIFRHYLNVSFTVGRNFRNPLYDDRKGSCNVFLDKRNNIYRMKDFGNEDYSGDPFWLVGYLTGLNLRSDFRQLLDRIIADMNLHITTTQEQYQPKESSVPVADEYFFEAKTKCYSEKELSYWSQYGIDECTLEKYAVQSMSVITGRSRSGNLFTIESTSVEPMYGYYIRYGTKTYVKIYRPKSKIRFIYLGAKDREHVFGYSQLPNMGHWLFLTGGEKDVMSLSAHGFDAISLNSETAGFPDRLYKDLRKRFTHIFILYDIDETGIRESNRLAQEYNLIPIRLELDSFEGKDISDYFRTRTRQDFLRLVCESVKDTPFDFDFPSVPSGIIWERLKNDFGNIQYGIFPLFPKTNEELLSLLGDLFLCQEGAITRDMAFISVTNTYIDELSGLLLPNFDIRTTSDLSGNLLKLIDSLLCGKTPPECIVVHDIDFIDDTEVPLKLRRAAEFYGISIICIPTTGPYKNEAFKRMLYVQTAQFI